MSTRDAVLVAVVGFIAATGVMRLIHVGDALAELKQRVTALEQQQHKHEARP